MTNKELRELNAWLAEHVMQWPECVNPLVAKFPCFIRFGHIVVYHQSAIKAIEFRPTRDASQAMDILQKCIPVKEPKFWRLEGMNCWRIVWMTGFESDAAVDAPTLEQVICLFAKRLGEMGFFGQNTKNATH